MSFDVDRQNASSVKCYRGVVADRSHTGAAPLNPPSWTRRQQLRTLPLDLTARTAKPILRAPSASRLPVPPLFASSAGLRFCGSAAEGRAAGGNVEGFPIRRSVTRARGRCKRCGSSLITRAHWGAPRERLWICKQDVFKDKPARRRLEICAIQ